jgi:outer membrane protein
MVSKFWILFFPLLTINISHAVEKITWEQGIQLAGNANAELKSAQSSLQASRYQINEARSGYLPVIAAKADYTFDSSVPGSEKTYSTTVTATENLFRGLSDNSRIDRAKSTTTSAEATLTATKAKVSYDLKNAFSGLLFSQKYIALTEDIIKRREANLKLVQLRFESGRENIGSLNLSKAYLAQARYDHLQAKNSQDVFQADLARVLGIDENYESIAVDGNVPTSVPPYEDNRQVDFKSMIKDIPEYRKALAQEMISKSDITLSRSEFFPSLNLTQTAGRSGKDGGFSNNTWAIGANLTFPLFNGGKDYYAVKSATEDYRASVHATKNVLETNVSKLKDLYTKYVEPL